MYVFIDTETGGLNHATDALLSIALLAVTPEGEIVDTLEEFVNPTTFTSPRNVSMAALNVNQLNLAELLQRGKHINDVTKAIDTFLNRWCTYKDKGIFVGWNVPFDLGFLHSVYDSSKIMHRRSLDLMSVAMFVQPGLKSYALSEVLKEHTINVLNHDAMGDVMGTYGLWMTYKEQL